jgi:MFS family permease
MIDSPKGPAVPALHSPERSARFVWIDSLLRPIQSFRLSYLPVLMVYFAYGALGLVAVARDFWIKESLTLTPSDLAGLAVWFNLPWTVKMVFGELVDCVPIFRSQRASYVLIGAAFTAAGLLALAGAAGGWLIFTSANKLYVLGWMAVVIGTVIQDVVADAMSTEVVPRKDASGAPRPEHDVRAELGMVQVLGRIAVSAGVLSVAGLAGVLAGMFSRETVFLIGLIVPAISITGVFVRRKTPAEWRPIDWRILGGGIVLGVIVIALGIGEVPFAQEVTFVISMALVCTMLFLVTQTLPPQTRRAILFTSIIIFAFRATPTTGDGYTWWTIDVLKFDEDFYGVLGQTSAVIGIIALWAFARQITEYSVTAVLFWIAVADTVLALPSIGLIYGLHHWTEANFGFGAHAISLIDAAAASPFDQLSMVPLLTLVAFYAPEGQRATWFALMASFMNLALAAGALQTKYLNDIFPIARGQYAELGPLYIWVVVLGLVIPVAAIVLFGRRVART